MLAELTAILPVFGQSGFLKVAISATIGET
jgi:hypothetical protein